MFGILSALIAIQAASQAATSELQLVKSARSQMTTDQFRQWQRERTEERRHQELCRAIRQAGKLSRFSIF